VTLHGGAGAAHAVEGLKALAASFFPTPREGFLDDLAHSCLYSDLFALDADGKELQSRMSLVGKTLRLEVDATGAHYPVPNPAVLNAARRATATIALTVDSA
jgi:hypothetical protein